MKLPFYIIIVILIIGITATNVFALQTFTEDVEISQSDVDTVFTVDSSGTSGNTFIISKTDGGTPHIQLEDTGSQIYRMRILDNSGRLDFWDVTNNKFPLVLKDGKIGVGVVPAEEFHLKNPKGRLHLESTAGASAMFIDAQGGEASIILSDIGGQKYKIRIPDGSTRLDFVDVTGGFSPMVISNGKVGINFLNPQEVLDVNGNIRLTGNIIPTGDICIGNCS